MDALQLQVIEGGLTETFNNSLILDSLTVKNLSDFIFSLIKNKKKLKKIQKN